MELVSSFSVRETVTAQKTVPQSVPVQIFNVIVFPK